jgi:hypothetical protein
LGFALQSGIDNGLGAIALSASPAAAANAIWLRAAACRGVPESADPFWQLVSLSFEPGQGHAHKLAETG